ncbi:hypothetical protein [Lysinibacillus sphaericus]|uniref:hypothetical protein n=1 Tax=Lysinibacillus sphaericus TaxID=1421 RepID=UPI0004DF813B|nr:hypothetical protein [Lysinibacillus sphaericus]QPA60696.1 hypothetical protein INQ55_10370 [Lysinibacillus sphaericus]
MIYLKTELSDGTKVDIEIYEDEFYTMCPNCRKESQIDFDELIKMLNEGLDFSSTSHFCADCSKEILKEQNRKEKFHLKLIK